MSSLFFFDSMENQLIKEILEKIINPQASLTLQVRDIFNYIRDIPYGDIGSRKPEDVYFKNKGTCSGKHELLKELYRFLGIEVKECIVIHHFKNLPVKFPSEIQTILLSEDIIDPHNFLKIQVNNQRVIVDCTRDIPMKDLGFPINENRDGESNQKICAVPEGEIIELEDALQYKENFIDKLTENQSKQRKFFLKKFTEWLDNRRKED